MVREEWPVMKLVRNTSIDEPCLCILVNAGQPLILLKETVSVPPKNLGTSAQFEMIGLNYSISSEIIRFIDPWLLMGACSVLYPYV